MNLSEHDLMKLYSGLALPLERCDVKLWYIASPYSHNDDAVRDERLDELKDCVRRMFESDMVSDGKYGVAISPVLCSYHLPSPRDGWYRWCLNLLSRCDSLKVLQQDGWQDSLGIHLELAFAYAKGIPITYLHPETLIEAFLPHK